jgi:UDP-N-acetylmuramate dehydrogenase
MIQYNKSLKAENTFGVEAKAKIYYELTSLEEITQLTKLVNENKRYLILGGGSNLLFCNDFNGIVIKNLLKGISKLEESDDYVFLSVNSGEVWDDFVQYCVANKFYGVENLTAIPGTVGAAPVQNIGAYGVELKDVFYSLEGYLIKEGKFISLNKDECEFGYRTSVFKTKLKDNFIITKVNFRLSKTPKFNLEYKSLKDSLINFAEKELTLKIVSDKVREIRNSKLPDYKILGNAGSFFKNPEISEEQFSELLKKYPDISYFRNDDKYKISAGWLIEKCGFKGKREGNVGSYEKQALVIVNYGGATGQEILSFAKKIIDEVQNNFNIRLEPEVNIIQ